MEELFVGSGSSCMHGASYQLKLLLLFLKRAVDKGYNFILTSEIEAAEKFDDVVFQYKEDGRDVLVLIQTKHKQNDGKKIQVQELLQKNGDYSLAKYFISFLKVKNNPDFDGKVLKKIVLCTNIHFDLEPCPARDNVRKLKNRPSPQNKGKDIFVVAVEGYDEFFRDGGVRFKFYCDSNNMVSTLKPFFKRSLNEEIKKLKNKADKLQDASDRRLIDQLDKIRQEQNTLERICNGDLEDEIKQYFDRLIFAVDQPDETKLSEIIKKELSEEFNNVDIANVYSRFHEWMTDWLKSRRRHFLDREDWVEFCATLKEEISRCFIFNVRKPIESFVGREGKLKEIHDSLNREEAAVICQQVSISGMGGIGKTELVRKYISEFGKEYHNIVWINAETKETTEESFRDLAKSFLGISVEKRDISSVVRDIYNFFTRRECLFVFDNAEKFGRDSEDAGIKNFLPSYVLPQGSNSLKVLITSRNQSWGDTPLIVLDVFTETEAFDFVTRELNIIKDLTQHRHVIILAEKLQYFPLALQQAVAYIKVKNIELSNVGSDFKIVDYIRRYKEETKNLLNFRFPEDSRDPYTKTTFTSMKITIDKIKGNSEYGKQASQILDVIALLASDNIPVEMFLELEQIKGDKEMLGSTIQLLRQYSLINSGQDKTQINIHRLLQQVIRIILRDQRREQQTFTDGLVMLKNYFINSEVKQNYSLTRQILTHSESFISHLDDWSQTYPDNKTKADSYFIELQTFMGEAYYDLSYSLKLKELLERAFEIQKKHYGHNHIEIAVTLNNLGGAYGALGNVQKQKELLERAFEIQKKHYGDNHIAIAATLNNLGTVYGALGNPQKEKQLFEQALQIQKKHYGNNHIEIAITLNNLGAAHGELGNVQKQKELLEQSLEIQKKHYGDKHFKIANTLSSLGDVYAALGNPLKQVEFSERALEIQKIHYGDNHIEIAGTLNNLGVAYGELGNVQKQKEFSEQALEIQKKHYGDNHIEIVATLNNLGGAYGSLGNPQKQKEFSERALQIQKEYFGYDHYEIATSLNNLGLAYGALGNPLKQKELSEQALQIKKKHFGENHFAIETTLNYLGAAYDALGNPQKKIEVLEQALEIQKKHYGDKNYKTARTLHNLGVTYGNLGNLLKLIDLLEQALEIEKKHYGDNHIKIATTLNNLGAAYGKLGNPLKQKKLLEQVLEIQKKHFGDNHIEIATTFNNLGYVYGALGKPLKQREMFEHADEIVKKHFGNVTILNIGF